MVQHLIVPVDGSPDSWRAFDVALTLAQRCGSDIRVVEVVRDAGEARTANAQLDNELQQRGPFDVDVSTEVRVRDSSVASELDAVLLLHPGSVVVMASHGRGRSAALVGSVTEDLLQQTFGPIILVGPNAEPGDLSGPVIVAVDGSQESEVALPLAAAWAAELGTTPWIINVAEPVSATANGHADVFETAYPARLATALRAYSGHAVEFDELHGQPERAVPDYASRHQASLIVATSHGRSGLSRLTMGSVTAGFVRHASCPVVVVRLPHPTHAESRERMWAY